MRISDVTFDIETGEVLHRWNVGEYSGRVAEARGEDQKAWNKSQINKSNTGTAAATGYGTAATAADPTAGFQAIAANPMSAEEKAGRLSATGGAFDSMATKAGERVAKTHNSAGYGDMLDELARGKSRAVDTTNASLSGEEFQRKMAALGGQANIYGTDVNAQTNLLRPGQPVAEPGFWDNFIMTAMGNANKAATMGAAGA